jgi:hypothetical protein
MAPGKHDEIRELLAPGDGGVVELSTERLEQLYLEVAPQVRQISSTTLSPNLFLKRRNHAHTQLLPLRPLVDPRRSRDRAAAQ